jgi:hypothetical protein
MKTIRFTQDWMRSRKGDVAEEGDGVAEILIQRRIAEEAADEDVADEGLSPLSAEAVRRVEDRRLKGPRERPN